MEFYSIVALRSFRFMLFQFPTGWNSTWAYRPKSKRECDVSIPNGMEFYLKAALKYSIGGSFNSQRDGILHGSIKILGYSLSFNSQRDGILLGWVWSCHLRASSFNSQRDGILPKYQGFSARALSFQFPTGWNSTARILPFFYVESVRSIYFYALKWTKFKKAPDCSMPEIRHFRILKATLSLSICIVSANIKILI